MELIHNTKYKIEFLFVFRIFSQRIQQIESILTFGAYFVKQIVILNIRFRFCVFFCIWEHTFNVFLTFFHRRRRRPLSVRPSRRPSRRSRLYSVRPYCRPSRRRPSSVRPSPVVRPVVVSPLSVRTVVRPVVVVRPLSVRRVVRLNITCKTSLKHPSDG